MSEAGKGDNTAKRTDFKKFWTNYPKKWKRKDKQGEQHAVSGKDDM